MTFRGITLPISYHVYGPIGEHLGRRKIVHGSHNDVRHLCWPNLGCESPIAETPKGSLCWENLRGWGVWLGGTDWGDCGRKVRKHACVFAGSDVRGMCKRITLTLSSVLTYMYVCRSMYHGRRKRGQGATAPPPLESGAVLPPYSGHPRPVAYIYFDFKSRPPPL